MSKLGAAFGYLGATVENVAESYKLSKAQSDVEQANLRKQYEQQKYEEEQAAQRMRDRAYRELMDSNATSKQINVQEINRASQNVASNVSNTQSMTATPNEPFDINRWNEGAQRRRENRRERIVRSGDDERFKREIFDMLEGISNDIRECVDKQTILSMRIDNLEARVANQLSGGKVLFSEGGGILSQSYQDMIIDRNIDSIFK